MQVFGCVCRRMYNILNSLSDSQESGELGVREDVVYG
ncbi:hypothetical protein SAMN05216584_10817 [Selenomonas sp. WCT3]|nr:hypothetical protein SAMN05216584_10817 [Selenomonas ruminantium]